MFLRFCISRVPWKTRSLSLQLPLRACCTSALCCPSLDLQKESGGPVFASSIFLRKNVKQQQQKDKWSAHLNDTGNLRTAYRVYSLMLLGSIEYHSMPVTSAGSKDEAGSSNRHIVLILWDPRLRSTLTMQSQISNRARLSQLIDKRVPRVHGKPGCEPVG